MQLRNSPLIVVLLLALSALACTLTAEAPPTLAPSSPLSTITPASAINAPTLIPVQPGINPVNPVSPTIEVKPPSGVTNPSAPVIQTNVSQVDINNMMRDMEALVSFQTRHVLSSPNPNTGIQAAENYLLNRFKEIAESSPYDYLTIDYYVQRFSLDWAGRRVYPGNVVLSVQGTEAASGVIVVAAHYDTTLQDWYNGDSYQPGANDNASGVVAVLELARLMVQHPQRSTILFVLFAAEETQREGSKSFVREFIQPNNLPIIAVINLDIIGASTGRRGERIDDTLRVFSAGPNTNSSSRQVARLVHVAAANYVPGMRVQVEDLTERSGRWGDHMSFSEVGYPAIRMIEMAENSLIQHTARDDISGIDPNYLRRSTQVALATLEMLAGGPNPPSLRPLSPSSNDPNSYTLQWSHSPTCQGYVIALRRPDSLVYNDFYTINATELSWNGFSNFESVTVGCIDTGGRLGRFAPELLIPR